MSLPMTESQSALGEDNEKPPKRKKIKKDAQVKVITFIYV